MKDLDAAAAVNEALRKALQAVKRGQGCVIIEDQSLKKAGVSLLMIIDLLLESESTWEAVPNQTHTEVSLFIGKHPLICRLEAGFAGNGHGSDSWRYVPVVRVL